MVVLSYCRGFGHVLTSSATSLGCLIDLPRLSVRRPLVVIVVFPAGTLGGFLFFVGALLEFWPQLPLPPVWTHEVRHLRGYACVVIY